MYFKTYLNHPINQKTLQKRNLRAITVLKKEGGGSPARYYHDHRFNGFFKPLSLFSFAGSGGTVSFLVLAPVLGWVSFTLSLLGSLGSWKCSTLYSGLVAAVSILASIISMIKPISSLFSLVLFCFCHIDKFLK